jgi:TIGR02436 family protein
METLCKKQMKQETPLSSKSFLLAVRIVRLYKHLTITKKEFVMAKQLLRSGTNPGAMVREADNAESSLDFIHKLSIAQKEVSEVVYWLNLLHETEYLTKDEHKSIQADAQEVMRLLRSAILTKKKKIEPIFNYIKSNATTPTKPLKKNLHPFPKQVRDKLSFILHP